MRNVIERPIYLNRLIRWKDQNVIKVITGIRRAGKSTLLMHLYRDHLLRNGVEQDQIIMVNLDAIENEPLCHYRALYDHIVQQLQPVRMNYVMIDEAQNAVDFQKAIDSLQLKDNVDIYITGSNAYLLSGELATLLSGRYVTIEVLPLSFREYVAMQANPDSIERMYRDYVIQGGFPYIGELSGNESMIDEYLQGLYNTVLKKDIVARNRISDVFVLEDVIRFVFDNIANITSSKKISDTLMSNGRKVSRPTVDTYLGYLVNSFAAFKVGRYDIKGKEHLKSLEKYYVADMGLRNHILGRRDIDRGRVLENIVYLELRRRGFEVTIGKFEDREIDFVVSDNDDVYYVQVAETIRGEETLLREIAPLRSIRDYHRRIVITLDYDVNRNYEGIMIVNALEWLLDKVDFK